MKTNTDQAGGALKEYQLELLRQLELVRAGKLPAVVLWREACSDLSAISTQLATLKAKAERVEALEGALRNLLEAGKHLANPATHDGLTLATAQAKARALLSTQPAPKGGPQ